MPSSRPPSPEQPSAPREQGVADTVPTGYLLTKVAQVVAARFAGAVADLGLRPKHYALLAAAAAAPAPGPTQQQLSRLLGTAPSAVVPAVDDLERLGAVERVPDPADRRRFAIRLTPAGHELFAEATWRGAGVDDEALAALSTDQRAALDEALGTVASALDLLPAPTERS